MICVNSRILSGHLTGVQRYLSEILDNVSQPLQTVQPAQPHSGISGHLWEQFVLPRNIGQSLLWSPSNTGPLMVKRQVVTIHDVTPLDHPKWLNPRFAAWYRFLLPRLVRRVRHVIAVSEFTKRRLLATTSVSSDRVTVVPNGVDARFRPHPPGDLDAANAILDLPSRKYVLTVGSLEPRKNLRRLLAAWRLAQDQISPDLWLVVAGAKGKSIVFGSETGTEVLPPRVHLTGHVQDNLLPALYAGATAFAYVSEYEGFGLPPLEAMASGIPVLVSDTTAFPEVVGDAGYYVDPCNVEDIARGLCRLLADCDGWEARRSIGLQRAGHFSWKRAAESTYRVLSAAAVQ